MKNIKICLLALFAAFFLYGCLPPSPLDHPGPKAAPREDGPPPPHHPAKPAPDEPPPHP